MAPARTRPLPPDCYDYQLDAHGCLIPGKETRYKLTEKGETAFRQWAKISLVAKPPMDQLDPKYRGNFEDRTCSLPTLYFGFVVTYDQVLDFAKARNLLPDPLGTNRIVSTALSIISSYLQYKCGVDEIHYNSVVSYERKYVLAIYTNYTIGYDQLVDEDEREVLDIIRNELGLGSQQAKWWWSRSQGLDQRIPPLQP
ncbi:hypothetical protein BC834DRAFT_972853 [Gloeopeniophorella convolvens]|nr:hypothetical protein BC834DRAFT_972853 [Gloeopeniophorella convolvens]